MKKEIALNPDRLTRLPPDLSIVGSAGGGRFLDAELSRQKLTGLMSGGLPEA